MDFLRKMFFIFISPLVLFMGFWFGIPFKEVLEDIRAVLYSEGGQKCQE